MDKKTLKALKGSIKKWERIEGSTRALDECSNCPLCVLFWDGMGCRACPVQIKTKRAYCIDSPHDEWCDHQADKHPRFKNNHRAKDCPTCLKLATKERKFLESLLPKGEK